MAASPDLTPTEARILQHLDERALVESLVELVRVPSVTGSAAESDLQQRQAVQLAAQGFDVDAWKLDLDSLAADPDCPGTEAARHEGYGLVGTLGPAGVPALALQGHIDVVPPGDLAKWEDSDPFRGTIHRDVLHGRGACDMKAGVAANLAVARTLAASGATLERGFALHSVVSEEDGGLGAFATLRRGHTAEAAVISEPTSGRIVTANAGALTFTIEVHGRAAHASTRLEGVSAFEAFLPIHEALQALETARNRDPDLRFDGNPLPYALSIGRIRAGDWGSSVPDLLTAEGRIGVIIGEDPADARRALVEAVAFACSRDRWLARNPAKVIWHGGQFGSGSLTDDHPLIEEVAGSIADLGGGSVARAAAPYGSDLRLYTGIGGIPTLHYGPGDVRFAHAPREQVNLHELVRVTTALLLLAVRRCGAHY